MTTDTARRRARRFDALFADPRTYMWVVSGDGTLERANGTARSLVDAGDATVRDETFWTLPWWADAETRDRVRGAVRRGLDGESVAFEASLADGSTADVSVRPVPGPDGATESLVVEGVDTTERTELERELRRSEELHRVTLNNMTDTVLVTDDDGAFTYVCPNVHFIVGYSAEEIRAMGTIDALLGSDFFDRDELDAEGVLTNVETAATDKAGREHTLLVNVRGVSIQGGTTLFSCRDVTKRKQRELALTALHRTARELLYAETDHDIGEAVVSAAAEALDLPAAAVYLIDTDENVLRPAATSDAMADLAEPLSPLATTADSLVGATFVDGETRTLADVHDSDLLADPAVELRTGVFVPLGEHGVLVAGSDAVGAFDEVTEELADLLAATAEAALDRVERETELRARDRELQRRNRQLTRLNRVNDIIREIDRALVRAETRAEIEHAVCERLTDDDRFAFAWIADRDDRSGELRPRAWAGAERGYLDAAEVTDRDPDDAPEPTARTVAGGDPTVVQNVAADLRAESWRAEALTRDYGSVASVPLAYDDFDYGALTVYGARPRAFDDTSLAVLEELGETIASAVGSVERKNALLNDDVVELEYATRDAGCVFLRLAREADCTLELEGGVHRDADGVRAFVTVEGASPATVVAAAEGSVAVRDASEIATAPDGGLVQLRLSESFVATSLAERGAMLRSLRADAESARLVVEVPSRLDVRAVDDLVSRTYADADLLAQRERRRDQGSVGVRDRFFDALTDRQLEVVRAAFHGGFFESPRDQTGEEVADALGISPAAFHDHVRTVQRKLFVALFEESTT